MKSTTYTSALRTETVKRLLAQGLTLEEAAKRIAILIKIGNSPASLACRAVSYSG